MTDLELIFTMLGEAATTKIARDKDAIGFAENRVAACAGGTVAGNARKDLEQKAGEKVITSENYLEQTKKQLDKKSSERAVEELAKSEEF